MLTEKGFPLKSFVFIKVKVLWALGNFKNMAATL